jgi:hypothetical protein
LVICSRTPPKGYPDDASPPVPVRCVLGRNVPWTICPPDDPSLGRSFPWTNRPLDEAFPWGRAIRPRFFLKKWTKRPRFFWDFCPFVICIANITTPTTQNSSVQQRFRAGRFRPRRGWIVQGTFRPGTHRTGTDRAGTHRQGTQIFWIRKLVQRHL